jgi:RES domain-containing protein
MWELAQPKTFFFAFTAASTVSPLQVFRVSLKAHFGTAFTGDGARLAGGRWNHKGRGVVYCSSSRALAAMEYLINVDWVTAPIEFFLVTVDVPSDVIMAVDIAALPTDWTSYPAPDAVKNIGTTWFDQYKSAALLVPSAVIAEENNLLINPEHPDFQRIRIGRSSTFTFRTRA